MKSKREEYIDFLKHIVDYYCDEYGHLQIVPDELGDELDPTYGKVVDEFLNKK